VYQIAPRFGIAGIGALPCPCVRRLLPLLLLVACGTGPASNPSVQPPTSPAASRPHDPDLALGKTCSGAPSADALLAALPVHNDEIVLLWPRVGKLVEDGECSSVARITTVNHQGVLVTVSLLLDAAVTSPGDFFRRDDHDMPRSVLETVPDPGVPQVRVRLEGAPSMDRDLLQTSGEMLGLESLAAAIAAAD
jgi:hypothetical protein